MASGSNSGISFGGALLLIFITLKLTNHIQWSWFWVLSPMWIGFAIIGVVLLVIAPFWVIGQVRRKRGMDKRIHEAWRRR